MCCKTDSAAEAESNIGISLIPKPLKMEILDGRFVLTSRTQVELEGDFHLLMPVAEYFTDMIKRAARWTLSFNESDDYNYDNTIKMALDEGRLDLGEEGYSLRVNPDFILLTASKPAGLFYGVQTIRQLLPPEIESPSPKKKNFIWTIPCVDITDKPQFAWRGLMLDVSRHFLPKEFIYKFIDHLAVHKLNTFHWHLVDDQGWRIEIKKYPKLTDIGAWRVDREDLHWNAREDQKPDEKATYGGFYTQKEIRDIVAYAQSRYVTIVPEIEMPGHTTAALAAYPQYSCTGGPFTVLPGGVWPITDIFCAGKEETFDFLEDILTEVLDLFPGQYIHIGGDEADKKEWKACELCQARIKAEGLKDEDELQSYFIRRIEKFIISKGRRLIGWDEILEGGLAPQAAVMSWRGTRGGIEAARQNHDVVMSPTSHCYFDYYQGNPDDEPLAIGGFLPLKLVYSFEPVPADLSPEEAEHILGAQANLWAEYVPTPEHAEYMLFPRTAALAEVVWSTQGKRIWEDFAARMERQFSRYDAAGIHYARSAFNVNVKSAFIKEKKRIAVRLDTELPQPVIRYTLNNKKPNSKSALYTDLILIEKTTMLKAGAFTGKKLVSPIREEKFTIHKATGKEVAIKYSYSEQYSGGGDHALIDSLRGSKNHRNGFWQGYEKKDLEVIIDLGKVMKIKRITSSFLHNIGSRIFLPTDVEYSVSENGKNFKAGVSLKNDDSPRISDRIIKKFSGKIKKVKTRYIKVHAKNIGLCPDWHFSPGERAWLFIDEIIIE